MTHFRTLFFTLINKELNKLYRNRRNFVLYDDPRGLLNVKYVRGILAMVQTLVVVSVTGESFRYWWKSHDSQMTYQR